MRVDFQIVMSRLFSTPALLAALLLPTSAQAQPSSSLFQIVNSAEVARVGLPAQRELAAITARPTTRSVRPIRFNDLAGLRSRTEGSFETTPGERVQVRAVRFAHTDGGFFWVARSPEGGFVQLSVQGDDVTGTVHTRNHAYTIQPLAGGLYALVELDPAASLPDEPEGFEALRSGSVPASSGETLTPRMSAQGTMTGTPATFDVLVVYTQAAAQAAQNQMSTTIGNVVNWSIQSMNSTFYGSGLSVTAHLVHSAQVTYTETGNVFTDVARLQNPSDGFMDNVHTLRNQYYADVVVLLTASGNACGVVPYVKVNAADAFALSKVDCSCSNYNVAHEVGHLAGGRHNNDASTSPDAFAHGYENTSAGWRTVMAVLSNAYRLPYWSDPDQSYYGNAMGTYSFNDNVRMWEVEGARLAGFRTPPPPSAPPSASISGPSSLQFKESATFTATATGGNGSYTYVWYRSDAGGTYYYAGCSTASCSQTMGNLDFDLRVDVTSGTQTASGFHHVTYDDCTSGPCASIGPVNPAVLVPARYALLPASPNPSHAETEIGYQLPEDAHVRLTVHDALGRQVAILVDADQQAGHRRVSWAGEGLPAGVYLYRFEASGGPSGPFTATGRLTRL